MLLDYNIIRKMIGIILIWASLLGILYVMDKYNKLIQEYNELLDDIECKQALIEKYEYKIWEFLKKLRELNNLTLDQDSDDK